MHVVTPLTAKEKDRLGWDEAKAFAQAVCSAMAQDRPGSLPAQHVKKQRTVKIFLDYLRTMT